MTVLTYPFFASLAMTLVTAYFSITVLTRWWQTRRPHLFAWGFGLFLYFIGGLSQVVLSFVWSGLFFRLWYWAGAIAVAAWLGQGTIFLLVRRGSAAKNIFAALVLVSIMTFIWMFITPLTPLDPWLQGVDLVTIKDEILPPFSGSVRAFVPITNAWGTLALIGGAIWSARLFANKQIMRNRVIGNWFIAAGGLLPAMGGYFIRLGVPNFKYTGDLLGAILIFIGYVVATRVPEAVQAQREARAAKTSGVSVGD